MKKFASLFLSLTIYLNLFSQPDCYNLIWQDEFSGTQLDTSKWTYQNGGWNGSNVQNCYVEANTSIANGVLKIDAKYEPGYQCFSNTTDFTSGFIQTKNKMDWTFGYFEARVKLPESNSTWPAIWMSPQDNIYGPWPQSGEIDIFEIKGHDLTKSYGNAHWGNVAGDQQQAKGTYSFAAGDDASNWHTYGLEWKLGELHFYIDGNYYHSIDDFDEPNATTHPGPFDIGFYLRINMAVGGNYLSSPWNDAYNGISQLPATMEVDWVRVYELDESCADNSEVSADCNIINNGNFVNGATNWYLFEYQNADGNINIEPNGFCKISVINGSTNNWHLALRQNDISLEMGKTYELTYDAYAENNRDISIILSDQAGSQYAYFLSSLSTSIQSYTNEFTMASATDLSAVLSFSVGNNTSDVYINNVVLKEIDCTEDICNTIENSGFQNNLDSWNLFTHSSAAGNLNVEANGFCKIEVIDGSSSSWHLALRQTDVLLENGETYEVSFKAYADANRSVSIILSDASGSQYNYASETLVTSSQDYLYSFVMNGATNPNGVFNFNVGDSNIDVYIDDIIVRKLNCGDGGCEDILNITNTVSSDATYQAAVQINCDAIIDANVNLKAGQELVFNSGFETQLSYNFSATIGDCNLPCSPSFGVEANSTQVYDAPIVCGVSDGISGMWVSRTNTDVLWHIADHDYNLHPDDHYLFAVSSTGNLLWSGSLSGVNTGNKDIEAITGFKLNNTWYLAIWENRWPHDEIQIIQEPNISVNQNLAYGITVPVEKIISPQGGIGGAGNAESLTWDESDDNMYLVQRGGADFNSNPTQAVWRIPNFSSLADGANPNEIFVASIQGRPAGVPANVHVGVGDSAISTNGDVFVMMGVGGTGDNKNEYLFWWTRDQANESWMDVLSATPIPENINSINTSSMGENVALLPNTQIVYYGNDWADGANSKIYRNDITYNICN